MNIIAETLSRLRLEQPITFRNMTMYPIVGGSIGEPDYVVLDDAIRLGSAKVTEISEQGSVPELSVVNDSDQLVFLLEGEELIGAKQNRVLNVSILAAAHVAVKIPVSCVEAGRWTARSREFRTAPQMHFAHGRAAKTSQVTESLRSTGDRDSNQSRVWEDIDMMISEMSVDTATSAMSDIFETRKADLRRFADAFRAVDGQRGALFLINDKIAGLDIFDFASTFQKLMPKLIQSYALDAIGPLESRKLNVKAEAANPAHFIDSIKEAVQEAFTSVGEGQDFRLSGQSVCGAALVARDRVVHLSAFRTREDQHQAGPKSASMSRPSARSARSRRNPKLSGQSGAGE